MVGLGLSPGGKNSGNPLALAENGARWELTILRIAAEVKRLLPVSAMVRGPTPFFCRAMF